jgi:hypothetical protein
MLPLTLLKTAWEAAKAAWAHRDAVLTGLCLILLLALWGLGEWSNAKIQALEAERDAKPKVVTKVVTRTVRGPVHTVTKTVEKPGGERVVIKEVLRDKVEVVRGEETASTPCSAPRRRRFDVGLGAPSPGFIAPRVGLKVFEDLTLSYRHVFGGPREYRHQGEVSYSF